MDKVRKLVHDKVFGESFVLETSIVFIQDEYWKGYQLKIRKVQQVDDWSWEYQSRNRRWGTNDATAMFIA